MNVIRVAKRILVSILQNTIKTLPGYLRFRFANSFQFYKIRLRLTKREDAERFSSVSILQNTIKTRLPLPRHRCKNRFQFYKIRLRQTGRRILGQRKVMFQFYKIRLRQNLINQIRTSKHLFQFYKIRLRLVGFQPLCYRNLFQFYKIRLRLYHKVVCIGLYQVSILQNTIKTIKNGGFMILK